jgi:hypothetical protein
MKRACSLNTNKDELAGWRACEFHPTIKKQIISTLTDSVQKMIFQLFHPRPLREKLKNQPFPSGIQGKKG